MIMTFFRHRRTGGYKNYMYIHTNLSVTDCVCKVENKIKKFI